MPSVCCVPDCNGNTKHGPKVHMFSFPVNQNLRKKWIAFVQRSNFVPTKNTRICGLHFLEEDIIRSISRRDCKTGKRVVCGLRYPRLKPNAVPMLICKQEKKEFPLEIKEESVDISEEDKYSADKVLTCYKNFNEFLRVFSLHEVPENWFSVVDSQKVTIFKTLCNPGPLTSYAVVISSTLKVQTFLYGQEVCISTNNLKTPYVTDSLIQITDILQTIDRQAANNGSDNRESLDCVLSHVKNILSDLRDDNNDRLGFVCEQLKLHKYSKERYRYSTKLMTLSTILFTINPNAYRFLRHSGFLVLPSPRVIKSVCNKFLRQPAREERHLFPSYARHMSRFLNENERHVILTVNEVSIEPYVDFERTKVVTAYAFVVTSINSDFSEVLYILPFREISYFGFYVFIKTMINALEESGYRVFCVVTNNNTINTAAMSNFAPNKNLSIVYPHPVDNNRPLFFLYDPLHLLKSIVHDWLSGSDLILNYPDFVTGVLKAASFNSLQKFLDENDGSSEELECIYHNDVFSSRIEGCTLNLATKIFDPFIVQSLSQLEDNNCDVKDTAGFIQLLSGWWQIVSNTVPEEGIVARSADSKLEFLEKLLNWLDAWKQNCDSHKLIETHSALYHTTHGLLEIVKYCRDELASNNLLLGKFQTDLMVHKFGKYRYLTRGKFKISTRHIYESEDKLAIRSPLSLKSRTLGDIDIEMFFDDIDEMDKQPSDMLFNPVVCINEFDFAVIKAETPVLTYLASYCCYNALKTLSCEYCEEKLVFRRKLEVEDVCKLTVNVSSCKLFHPRDAVVQIVSIIYIVFNKLLHHFDKDFSRISNKNDVITKFMFDYVTEEGYFVHFRGCADHKEECTGKFVVTWVTNTFLKNYYGRSGLSRKRMLNS